MAHEIGVAVLGTGWVSNEHIQAYKRNPHTDVRGILSRESTRARAKAEEHGLAGCRAFDDLDELLRDDSIHAVSICTPHHLHAPQGGACAQAGKHVLLEKPMALDLPGLRQLCRAIEQAKVKSVVSFVLRWNPLFETIQAMLAEKQIGNIFYAGVDYMHGIGPWYTGYGWITKREFGGNNLLTGGCHAIDAVRWFVGGEVEEVFAYANTGPQNRLGFEYDPNSVTLMKFAHGPVAKTACSIEGVMPYTFPIELLGEEGTIRNNTFYLERWRGMKDWATIPTIMPDSADVSHHPFQGEIDHFIDCIRHDRESHCNAADAFKTHEVCLAMEISVRENRPVRLPLPD